MDDRLIFSSCSLSLIPSSLSAKSVPLSGMMVITEKRKGRERERAEGYGIDSLKHSLIRIPFFHLPLFPFSPWFFFFPLSSLVCHRSQNYTENLDYIYNHRHDDDDNDEKGPFHSQSWFADCPRNEGSRIGREEEENWERWAIERRKERNDQKAKWKSDLLFMKRERCFSHSHQFLSYSLLLSVFSHFN